MNQPPENARPASGVVRRTSGAPLAFAALLLSLAPTAALAYIDPGTGSMLIQSLLAAIAAALVFGRTIWYRVKSLFTRDKGKSADPEG